MDNDLRSAFEPDRKHRWRGPTIHAIARASGVGTATVDRVLNGRGGVRAVTSQKVLDALAELGDGPQQETAAAHRKIAFLTESGVSFNQSLEEAVEVYRAAHESVDCSFTAVATADLNPIRFAQLLERTAEEADGLIVVAREDLTINRAIRSVSARGVPVVCVTTDLPSSHRFAYVGCDQTSAGATAAYLMGRLAAARAGKILLVMSAPYRCQEEREVGFRRVLRTEFADLEVDERVSSNDEVDYSYRNVRRYIDEHGAPVGIYNVAGGNVGIARALRDADLHGKVVFIGHELNANSRMLLESGEMDIVVGHDLEREVAQSVETIDAFLDQRPPPAALPTKVSVYTKFNCG